MRLLIYDGTCGVCQEVIEYFIRKGMIKKEELLAISSKRDLQMVEKRFEFHVSEFNEMIYISDSKVFLGYDAFRAMFCQSNSFFKFFFFLPLSSVVGPWAYRFFAKNRHKFSKNSSCGLS